MIAVPETYVARKCTFFEMKFVRNGIMKSDFPNSFIILTLKTMCRRVFIKDLIHNIFMVPLTGSFFPSEKNI